MTEFNADSAGCVPPLCERSAVKFGDVILIEFERHLAANAKVGDGLECSRPLAEPMCQRGDRAYRVLLMLHVAKPEADELRTETLD